MYRQANGRAVNVFARWHQANELRQDARIDRAGELGSAVADLAYALKKVIWDRTGQVSWADSARSLVRAGGFFQHSLFADTMTQLDRRNCSTARSFIINTEAACDEAALPDARILHLGEVGFDVVSVEPPPIDHPMLQLRSNDCDAAYRWLAEARQRMIDPS